MPKRNAHQKAARELQAAEGIGYQEALKRVRAATEPATTEPSAASAPPAAAFVLEPTATEAELGITAEELGVRALPADATPARRAHAEAVWRTETDPARPCRCSGVNCHHGEPCAEDYDTDDVQCTGRMVHVDRHPGSMFDLRAWYDVYRCNECGETAEATVTLPDLPWGEVRSRDEVEGERYTGGAGEERVTVIYSGIRHPNFPDRAHDEDDEDGRDPDPDDYPTPEDDHYCYYGDEDEELLDDGPEDDVDPIGEPSEDDVDGLPEAELGPPFRAPAVDRDPQPTAAEWSVLDQAPRAW
ncbi:hypothetical protein [Streptomyces violascens]|uniref:hypothetical protein n=1 Tax=Streptomyces violascens TaxID=67381 RepID=UPI0036A31B8C